MPSQAQIEKQIRTVEDLRDVIGSMRSLAAIYLRRAEERLDGLRAYADTVGRAIEDCLFGRVIRLPEGPSRRRDLVLAFFSEQGLCGRFNEVMAEAAAENAPSLDRPAFLVVGRRGPGLLRRAGLDIAAELPSATSPDGADAVIHRTAKRVLGLLAEERFARLHLLHARYLSPGRIEPNFERVLPIDLDRLRKRSDPHRPQPTLALPRLGLLAELAHEHAFVSLFRAMTESLASENGMRLHSMEAARNNIEDKLSELQLRERIQRQNEITSELLDVIGGAEALAVSG